MAAKYARAGGGNWSADATWSTTSGGAADTTAPTAADDVFLNASSGAVTIDSGAERACRSINCTGYTNTLRHNAATVLNIGDATAGASNIALKFVAAMTYTIDNATSSSIEFESTSATVQTIDFAGKTTASIAFNGGGASTCSYQYTGQHVTGATATVYLVRGTLDINGQTCSWGLFNSDNSNTRALTLGAASITCTGGGNAWTINTATGMTLSANNAGCTITLSGAAANFLAGNGFTYNDVVFTGSGALYFSGTTNFRNVTRTGTAAKTDTFSIGGAPTISGTFTCNGNSSINRVQVLSSTVGTARTITAATVAVSNTDFQDITGAGAGSWDFSARTDIGDAGGNSGITFPASVPQYYGGVNLNGSYLRCNGIASNYCYTPNAAPIQVLGDMTIDVKVSCDDWTPSVAMGLVTKNLSTGNQRSYSLSLNTSGTLFLSYSIDGVASSFPTSTVGTGLADGSTKWLRATHDVNDGSGNNITTYYMSDDGVSWSQLGDPVVTAGTIARFNSSAVLEFGSANGGAGNNLIGKIYRARIYSDITQTTKVFDADFTAQAAGTKSFTESSANAATVSLVVTGGNWSASSWTTRVPLPQDDTYLGNAFSASQTVTADMPRLGRSIDWTGATGSPTFANTTSDVVYGSMTYISAMTLGSSAIMTFSGRGSYTITCNGKTVPWGTTILAYGGTYTLNDAYISSSGSAFTLTNGTFDSAGFAVTQSSMSSNNNNTRVLTITNSIFTLTGTAAATTWDMSGSNATVNALGSTIVYSAASTNGRNFSSGGKTYGVLTYTVAGSTGQLKIQGGNASFDTINFSDASNARTLVIDTGQTITIRSGNGFNVQGTAGKLITINSGVAATHTVSSPNKQVCSYLNVDYSVATGGGAWYAQSTSTDGGHNTGWIFTDAPTDTVFPSNSGLVSLRNLQNLQKL